MRATPPHCRAHTGPPRRPCASGPSPSTGSPCVTFLIRLPEVPARRIHLTRGTGPTAAREAPRMAPWGLPHYFPVYQVPPAAIRHGPDTHSTSLRRSPANDFRRTFGFNHLAALPHRYSVQKKRHAGTTQIPVVSPTANPPRGTPSPRHSERGRRNATAPQHPGRHPPAIHRPTVTAPPCRRNQG